MNIYVIDIIIDSDLSVPKRKATELVGLNLSYKEYIYLMTSANMPCFAIL